MSDSEGRKFDALATLIAANHEDQKQALKSFKEFIDYRFSGLEEYNKKQNGSILKVVEQVAQVEREQFQRGLTCKKTVEAMSSNLKYIKLVKWVDGHVKLSIVLFVVMVFISTGIIYIATESGWLVKLIKMITGLFT